MEFIAHRINTIRELQQVPVKYGVEIDLRDRGNKLILAHDPFINGEDFENYLKHYHHGTMILNIKCEGIEQHALQLIEKYEINNYFFLDSSFPMIYRLSNTGEKNIAIRLSEFEGIDTILNMEGRFNWVWIDCFSQLPISQKIYQTLKINGLKICLVSPELQGQQNKLEKYRSYLESEEIVIDAVCTKLFNIKKWQ